MSELFVDKRNIGQWNISKVIDMFDMFYNCENFNQDINEWDIGNIIYIGFKILAY